MSLNCGDSFVKYLLCLFNFIIFLAGGTLIAVSAWVAIDTTSFLLITRLSDNSNLQYHNEASFLETGAYILILAGALLLLLGFLGCCGALMEAKGLLATYGVLITLIFILEITGGILLCVYKREVETQLEDFLTTTLKEQYSNPDTPNSMTVTWDAMMTNMECCGVYNYTDFISSVRWQENNTYDQVVPRACCIPLIGGKEIQEGVTMEGVEAYELLDENCIVNPTENNSYYETGCHERLIHFLDSSILLGIAVLSGIMLLEVLLLTLVICLCRAVGSKPK